MADELIYTGVRSKRFQLPVLLILSSLAIIMFHAKRVDVDVKKVHFVECPDFRPRVDHENSDPDGSEHVLDLVGDYGRLGNKLLSVLNLFALAKEYCCAIRLPRDMLQDWESVEWQWTPTNCLNFDKAQCRTFSAQEAFYLEPDIGGSRARCATELEKLRRYFGINVTHVLERQCPQRSFGAIHVRSGDVAAGQYDETTGHFHSHKVHSEYGPYPTSYYMNAVLAMKGAGIRDVMVICEDFANPTCETFRTFSIVDKSTRVLTGRTLLEDLRDLLCATEVAMSFGTFQILLKLSTRVQILHEFSEFPLEGSTETCHETCIATKFHWISDPSVRTTYVESVRRGNWTNTEYQRYLVNRYYPIESVVIETQRTLA